MQIDIQLFANELTAPKFSEVPVSKSHRNAAVTLLSGAVSILDGFGFEGNSDQMRLLMEHLKTHFVSGNCASEQAYNEAMLCLDWLNEKQIKMA